MCACVCIFGSCECIIICVGVCVCVRGGGCSHACVYVCVHCRVHDVCMWLWVCSCHACVHVFCVTKQRRRPPPVLFSWLTNNFLCIQPPPLCSHGLLATSFLSTSPPPPPPFCSHGLLTTSFLSPGGGGGGIERKLLVSHENKTGVG